MKTIKSTELFLDERCITPFGFEYITDGEMILYMVESRDGESIRVFFEKIIGPISKYKTKTDFAQSYCVEVRHLFHFDETVKNRIGKLGAIVFTADKVRIKFVVDCLFAMYKNGTLSKIKRFEKSGVINSSDLKSLENQ